MTTREDIIIDQLTNTLMRLKNRGLINEFDYVAFMDDMRDSIGYAGYDDTPATTEQIEWNNLTRI